MKPNYHRIDPDAPHLAVVAAVWPERFREWVAEDSPRFERLWRDDGWTSARPFSTELKAELENEMNAHLEAAGLPPRQAGGVWRVQLPPPWTSLNKYLASVFRRAARAGLSGRSNEPEWASFVRETIAADFEKGRG